MPVRLTSQEEPLPGYKLLERLGRGGFGEVWKVEAPGGLHKAMKFVFGDLDSADDDGKPAEQELKALNRIKSIRHPYILSLERYDIIDGQLIIVMELADRNLWDRFRECRAQGMPGIPREELLRYLEEAAEALDLMNNQYQIQHLDIKPQNLFLLYNHVKVADFGLAKDFEGARGTMTGGVTPVYAAPETFEGYLSRFTDQYSLAIVFQELLTGVRPFVGANTKQLLLQHLNSPPDLRSVSESDRPILARALAKSPSDRWPSCTELMRNLRASGSSTPMVAPPGVPVPSLLPPPASPPTTPAPIAPPMSSPFLPRDTTPTRMSPAGVNWLDGPPTQTPSQSPVLPVGESPRPTPLPSLVTPRLVTPQTVGGHPGHLTVQRPQVFQTARMNSLGIAPPEKTGEGVLFPALVIGIGQSGLGVLQSLRRLIRERWESAATVPNIRFLYIDTDPQATASALQGPDALNHQEVILARLNRPAHYLQQDRLPAVESWLPPGLLYQLPKNAGPAAGVRPFGRLALCDHYRQIAQRIRQEIEPFLVDELLDKTAAQTGLGLRSNRPRAYLIANLAGGTGSGMLVDLAYLVKHELRAVGYRKPDTIGVLLAPHVEADTARTLAVANTFAAFTELAYFGEGNRYITRFDTKEPPISDPDGPFTRTLVHSLPRSSKERELIRTQGSIAQNLFLELLTPAGPVLDATRTACAAPSGRVELTGNFQLCWPRPHMLTSATRRFAQRLLQRWASKDTTHLRAPISQWLAEQWTKRQFDWESVQARLHDAFQVTLQEAPAAVFDSIVDVLRTNTPTRSRVDLDVACHVLEDLLKLVGKPVLEPDIPGTLAPILASKRKELAAEADTTLATIAVSFLEQPQYRLAGAEEALTQLASRLRRTIDSLEATLQTLQREVADRYTQLLQIIGEYGPGSKAAAVAELPELLRVFPIKKLDYDLCEAGLGFYRTLLANIPEYRQEVSFCRKRFEDLHAGLTASDDTQVLCGPGEVLLPTGCATLDEAADVFLSRLAPEEILSFDQHLQKLIRKQFRGMVNVCMKPERSSEFLALVSAEAHAFLDSWLEHLDSAAAFWQFRTHDEQVEATLTQSLTQALPTPLPPPGALGTILLAVPAGPDGERIIYALTTTCADTAFLTVQSPDNIAIVRTYGNIARADLPPCGPVGREAYQAYSDRPLHSRVDVNWTS
ncbi:MAG: protein kinase [Bacteroidales bacterium]|nr:protein kinase [Bacteroidales bacterium]